MLIAARDEEAGARTAKTGLTANELRDEVLTIFLAGYETVANALSWTWLLLGQNPEAEAKLHAELDTALAGRLPTLEDLSTPALYRDGRRRSHASLSASMGHGPPGNTDVEIGPYRLPRGSFLFFSQYIVQRNEKFFPDPGVLPPERFTAEAKATRPKFAYFPFGGGGRQCIGESFAWMEAVLVLATLAQRWRLQVVENQNIALQPKITLRPKFGIQVIPKTRP
jgi:cytochrome P450